MLRTQSQFPGNFPSNSMPFWKVILKGQVLGIVDHFYWKKEYQNRGSPHYHVLLWIRDAPLIDSLGDDPEKVLDWIQDRITCHIPDEQGSPELPTAQNIPDDHESNSL